MKSAAISEVQRAEHRQRARGKSAGRRRSRRSSGDPGAGSSIIIRGLKTIQGDGQPLFVVDGQPIDNSTTQRPNDFSDAHGVHEPRGRHQSERHRVDRDSEGRGRLGDLRRARRAGRHADHDEEWPRGTDALFVPLDVDVGRRQQGASRCSASTAAGRKAASAGDCATDRVLSDIVELGPDAHAGHADVRPLGRGVRTPATRSTTCCPSPAATTAARSSRPAATRTRTARSSATTTSTTGQRPPQGDAQFFGSKLRVGGNVVVHGRAQRRYIQKGNNLNGLLLGSLRTPPDFNNFPYVVDGLHRSYRYPNPANATDDRVYDNPFWVINRDENTSDVNRAIGNFDISWDALRWLN